MPLSRVLLLAGALSKVGQKRGTSGSFWLTQNLNGRSIQSLGPPCTSQNPSAQIAHNVCSLIGNLPSPPVSQKVTAHREQLLGTACLLPPASMAWGRQYNAFSVSKAAVCTLPSSFAATDDSLTGRRAFSAEVAPGGHVDLPHHRFAVSVGSLLKVVAPHTDMDIDVAVGEDLETVLLEAKWNGDTEGRRLMKITSTHTDIAIKEMEGPVPGSDSEIHPFPVPSLLKAWIPERWCSVHLESGKGAVSLESVVEGHLHVETAGGPIKLGKVRGSASRLSSSGGSIQASSISAALMVRSGGGAVNIQRLLSNKLDMVTAGGDVTFGSVYGEWVTINTNGGALTAKHMRSTKLTSIVTATGNVHIDGLDGNAKVSTNGGRVELQLHQHAKEVEVDSGGGDVLVYMPSTLNAKVEYEGSGDFQQEGAGEGSSDPLAVGASGRLVGRFGTEPAAVEQGYKGVGNSYSSSGRMDQAAQGPGAGTLAGAAANGNEHLEELPTCRLVIKGGNGNVLVKRRSWMELVAARSREKTADSQAPNFEMW